MRRTLNIKVLAIVLGVLGAGAVAVRAVHNTQVRRNSASLLEQSARAKEAGDLDGAAEYLERYLGFEPGDQDALAGYAALLDDITLKGPPRSKARQKAYLVLVRAASAGRPEIRRRAARAAIELRYFREAQDYLTAPGPDPKAPSKGEGPDPGEVKELLGRALIGLGQDAEAAKALEEAIGASPGRIEAYQLRANLLRARLKDPKGADATMEVLIAANPRSAEAYLARYSYRREFRLDGVAADAAEALKLAPEAPEALLAAADAARLAGDQDRARAHLGRGAKLNPTEARWPLALADLETQVGRPEAAIEQLRRGLGAIPGDANLTWNLADLLITTGRLEEASRLAEGLDRAADREPAAADYLRARLHIARRRYSKAAELLAQAGPRLAANPPLALKADLLLADCQGRLGDAPAQLAALRRAHDLAPNAAAVRRALAAALANGGRLDEARRVFQLRFAGADEAEARLDDARLLIAYDEAHPGDPGRAEAIDQALAKASRLLPESIDVVLLRAETLLARGEHARASESLRAARAEQPDRIELWIASAVLTERGPAPGEALTLLEQARTRLGDSAALRLARAQYWLRHPDGETEKNLESLAVGLDKFPDADRERLLAGLANAFLQAGAVERAIALWGELLDRQPNNLDLRLVVFDAALVAGNDETADRQLAEVRKLEGPDGYLWRFGEAARLIARAKPGDAEALKQARTRLDEVAAREPSWHRVALARAQIAEREGNPEAAIEQYLKAVEQGERQVTTFRRLAQLLSEQGRFAEIGKVIQDLEAGGAPAPALTKLAAEASLRGNDGERALDLARRAVRADSKSYTDQIWLGQVSWASGKLAEAEAAFRRAVALAGAEPAPWLALVQFLAQTGQMAPAAAELARAEKALPPARAPLALAQCAAAIGKFDQAETRLDEALKARPDDIATLHFAAEFYIRTAKPRQAEPILSKLTDPKTAPRAERAWARRRLALVMAPNADAARTDAALALIDENLREDASSDADRRARAYVLAMQPGRRAEAAEALSKVATAGGTVAPADRYLYAQILKAKGDRAAALDQLRALVAGQPKNPRYLATFVEELLGHANYPEAEAALRRLEELDPKGLGPVALRARLLAGRGEPAQAVALVQQAASERMAQVDGANDQAARTALNAQLEGLAALLERLKQYEAAEAMYRTYVDRAKAERPEAVLALAGFLGRQGKAGPALDLCEPAWAGPDPEPVAEVALEILSSSGGPAAASGRVAAKLEAAIAKAKDPAPLLFHLANLRSLQGDYPKAEEAYRQIIQRRSDLSVPMNNLAWLLALGRGQASEALKLIDRAIQLEGLKPDLLDTRALVHLALGRPEAAIQDLTRALDAGRSPEMLAHLAEAQAAAGNKPAALQAIKEATDAGFNPKALHPLERKLYDRLVAPLAQR